MHGVDGGGRALWAEAAGAQCQSVSSFDTVATFNSVPSAVGLAVVAISDEMNRTLDSVTIDGNLATAAASTPGAHLYYANSSSSSITVVVTGIAFNGFIDICIGIGVLTGANATPTCAPSCPVLANDNVAEPISLGSAIAVPANGVGIVMLKNTRFGAHLPLVWTNATRDAATEAETAAGGNNGTTVGMAHLTATGTPEVSCGGASSCNKSGTAMVGAAWGP